MTVENKSYECCILGAGPAGVGAALELTRRGTTNILIIDQNTIVGGLARTEKVDGARFDVGPHRFFTKNKEINQLWHDLLKEDFYPVSRLTRIYYNHRYFQYPVKAFDVLKKLGGIESLQVMSSYLLTHLQPKKEALTFEDWVTQKFGRKLYETFFKTYTEKIWGIPCKEIGAEWAAQRIKGLDIREVIKNALITSGQQIKTLVEEFDYPVLGAGQMYEAMCDEAVSKGAELMLGAKVVGFEQKDNRIVSVEVKAPQGQTIKVEAKQFFSSIPMTHFFKMLAPEESARVQQAVDALYYRDHITVNLLVDGKDLFPDQWIYLHSQDVKAARLANYNNFSSRMSGDENKTALSIEYFVFQDDAEWKMSDQELIDLAKQEIEYLKLVKQEQVEKAWVLRETEAYPVYFMGFQPHYDLLKNRANEFKNIMLMGRGGMYKYNNQDHSIISGILAARNYLRLPGSPYDLWEINVDAEYCESSERVSS